jgi:hypothetical protein
MKTKAILLVSLSFLLGGCFAPINLTYDSAKNLQEGQIEVNGSYSRYYVKDDSSKSTAFLNNNYGFSVGYGVTDKYTVKLRYERITPSLEFQKIFGSDISDEFKTMTSMNYFEINNKMMFVKDKIALGLPVGIYTFNGSSIDKGGLGWVCLDPRLFVTFFRSTDIFDLTVVPKLHVLLGTFGGYAQFGVSVGMGLSSDLDKWAIRPEIGYDRFLSFGVGANFNFNTKKTGTAK